MSWFIQNMDPHRRSGTWGCQTFALAYEGLVTPTSVGERLRITKEKGPDAVPEVQPMLAEAWDIEEGGRRYVFHLKKGVKFHHGKELDAADIVWNWERVKDPKHSAMARAILAPFLEKTEVADKYTAVAHLSQPYAAFLMANSWTNVPILPKDCIPYGAIWGQTPTFKPTTDAPPGTGPFEIVEYQQKYQEVFKAFKDYRVEGLPYLDEIIYKCIPKDSPRTMALRAGDLDYIYLPEKNWLTSVMTGNQDKINQVINLEKDKLCLYPYLSGSTNTFYVNCHDDLPTPFKDVRMRQAFDFCIDREKLTKALYGDLAVPMVQGFHPDISPWGFRDIKGRTRNIEKAKQLMAEAGYPDGVDITMKITGEGGLVDQAAQILQQMARPAGFRVHIDIKEGVQYWSVLRTLDYDLMHYALYKEDPMNIYWRFLHTDERWSGILKGRSYGMGVKDPIMDKLLDEQAAEIDPIKRKEKFRKVVERSIDQAYFIPYLMAIWASAWSPKIKNLNPQNYYFPEQALREVWVES